MQTIYTGIIVDDMIRLDDPIGLPNGQAVKVVLLPQESTQESTHPFSPEDMEFLDELMRSRSEYMECVRRCDGALADLPQTEFDDLDEIIAARHQAFFREVEE